MCILLEKCLLVIPCNSKNRWVYGKKVDMARRLLQLLKLGLQSAGMGKCEWLLLYWLWDSCVNSPWSPWRSIVMYPNTWPSPGWWRGSLLSLSLPKEPKGSTNLRTKTETARVTVTMLIIEVLGFVWNDFSKSFGHLDIIKHTHHEHQWWCYISVAYFVQQSLWWLSQLVMVVRFWYQWIQNIVLKSLNDLGSEWKWKETCYAPFPQIPLPSSPLLSCCY